MNTLRKSASALALAAALALSGCAQLHLPGWEKDYPAVAYSRDLHPGYGSVHAIEEIRPEKSGIGVAPLPVP